MWIRELPQNYQEQPSGCYHSIMLWYNKKVYVMDNHLSAAWCWLQSCDPLKKYNFMHIDRHYDMLDCFYDEDLEPLRKNPHMQYDEFKSLMSTKGEAFEVFRWDNYIMATFYLRPDWFNTNIFLTHKEGSKTGGWRDKSLPTLREDDPLYIDFHISQDIGEPSEYLDIFNGDNHKLPWIVNLDLDVFYTRHTPHIQLHSDEYIRFIARLLNDNMHNIQVLTIALSPECLAGEELKDNWNNAFRILKIMSEEIEYLKTFPFPKP